jgi:predicted HD phosphohydrolase
LILPPGTYVTRLDDIPADRLRSNEEGGNARAMLRLIAALEGVERQMPVDQLTHSLQTATRAERAGASDELVVAALCHDAAKALPHTDHARLGAELLRPFVSSDTYWLLRTHQAFQARHFASKNGADPDARRRYRRRRWYATAERFSDEWDRMSMDPHYDTLPLEHFVPVVERVFGRTAHAPPPRWRGFVGRIPGAQTAVHVLRDRLP